jgi:hypothetical protein
VERLKINGFTESLFAVSRIWAGVFANSFWRCSDQELKTVDEWVAWLSPGRRKRVRQRANMPHQNHVGTARLLSPEFDCQLMLRSASMDPDFTGPGIGGWLNQHQAGKKYSHSRTVLGPVVNWGEWHGTFSSLGFWFYS